MDGTVILVSVGSIFVEQVPITFQTPLDPLALFVTIFLIAATYFGWEQATYLAGETKNGQTVVPKALMHATIAVFVLCMLYVLAAFLTLGEGVASATRLLVSMGQMQFGTSAPFAILTYLALIGTVATWIISSPRLLLSMAQDGLLLKQLARISPKYRTPSVAIVVQTGIILLFMVAGLESTESLLKLLMPLALFMYCSVMFAMVKLRITKPDHPRPFKAPFGIVGPIAMVLFFAALCIFWVVSDPESIGYVALGVSFFAVGIPLFFLVELYNNAQFSSRIKDISAWYTRLFERYILPLDVRKEILLYLGSLKGKTVVEYGCSTGTLTKSLQESVGGVGCIYCVNNSKVELMFAQSRLVHDIETHRAPVEFIYSPTYTTHVPPRIMSADAIVSIDTLSALSDPLPLLKQLSRLLPEHGHVCFFDFGDFFKLIPDQSWLASDESIKTMFLEAGMSVRVKRKYTSLWSYVFIYGIKSKEPVVII